MYPFQKHYYEVVQRDFILSDNVSTVSMLPGPKKIMLCLGGGGSDDNYVLSSLAALNIITGQKPLLTQQKINKHRNSGSRDPVGGKLTLRRAGMYRFWYKLIFNVLPRMRQFEGLCAPAHNNIYCFLLKDMFSFEELVPLFPYFESLGSLQCQFYFTTKNTSEIVTLGQGLQFCFLPTDK